MIAIDPRGAGLSDKPDEPYTGELVAGDVAAALEAAGVERAHLVGMSMGGMIAQEVAIRRSERVKSLLLVSTYAAVDEWSRRVLEVRRSIIEQLGLGEHFRLSVLFVFSPKAFRTMRDWIAGLERRLAENPPGERAYLRQLDFCVAHDAVDRLAVVSAPTLVLTGSEDILTSRFQGRELAGMIPGAEYREIPEASHGLVWEEPELFAETVAAFADRHSG